MVAHVCTRSKKAVLSTALVSVVAAVAFWAGASWERNREIPFNAVLWRTAGELTSQLIDLIDAGAGNEDIQAGAEALRDVLAEHI